MQMQSKHSLLFCCGTAVQNPGSCTPLRIRDNGLRGVEDKLPAERFLPLLNRTIVDWSFAVEGLEAIGAWLLLVYHYFTVLSGINIFGLDKDE